MENTGGNVFAYDCQGGKLCGFIALGETVSYTRYHATRAREARYVFVKPDINPQHPNIDE